MLGLVEVGLEIDVQGERHRVSYRSLDLIDRIAELGVRE
jgi:hypothetical protein